MGREGRASRGEETDRRWCTWGSAPASSCLESNVGGGKEGKGGRASAISTDKGVWRAGMCPSLGEEAGGRWTKDQVQDSPSDRV